MVRRLVRTAARRPLVAVAALAAAAAIAWPVAGQESLGLPPGGRVAPPPPAERVQTLRQRGVPFGPGEKLEFSIEYGPIKAGTATLGVAPMRSYQGRPCFHFYSEARSAPFFDKVYKVRDRIDSLVDAERWISWQYRKVQREGNYKADHEIVYDHAKRRATYADGKTASFPENALDALGAFYFTRVQPIAVGQSFYIPHHSDKKSYYLEVEVQGRETIDSPAGRFDCWVVEPKVRESGPFKNQGTLTIWLTADERRLPVLMKSKVAVGSIAAVLQQITYGSAAPLASSGAGAGS